MGSAIQNGADGLLSSGVPRAELPPFELTPPPVLVRSRTDFLIAEMERRFGGRVVWVDRPKREAIPGPEEILDPEECAPFQVEPEWERLGFRGQVGKLLWMRGIEAEKGEDSKSAGRLKKKAIRFVSCNKCARSGLCSRYPEEHKFFIPNGCEVVFCKECANEVRRELFLAYQAVALGVILPSGAVPIIPKGWVLARVNFTLRSDGSEITPERVKKFNACVRAVMRRAVGSRNGFGMLFVDEVGFETRGHLPDSERVAHGLNLHCHGLYFGPWHFTRECWERTRDLWMEETREKFGVESRGFYIRHVRGFAADPARAIRWALNHMLKYVSKPPAVTPERLTSLIAAFDGARRVHSLGLFYGKKPEREKRDCPCPKCRAMGIVSVVGFEGRALSNGGCVPRLEPIENLLARGYLPLREVGRNAVFAMGASRQESWGQSP